MSNDVVISKELRDRILAHGVHTREGELINEALRAAPETLSLEGVEKSLESLAHLAEGGIIGQHLADFPGMVGRKVRQILSDLRRLVTPVQPSAVVSRESDGSVTVSGRRYAEWPKNAWRGTPAHAVETYYPDAEMVPACAYDAALADRNALIRLLAQLPQPIAPVQPSTVVSEWQRVAHVLGERLGRTGPEGYYSMTPDKWLEWATEEVGHLHYQVEQKPVHHPVAPVQSGGVDRESLWEAIRYSELVDDDVAGEIVDIVIAHLTTTQSSKENNLEKQ
jgi:hypothetical protein